MAAKKTNEPVPEINPARGGSYVRNPDGTLTQTEGPQHQPDVAPDPAANPTQTTQE